MKPVKAEELVEADVSFDMKILPDPFLELSQPGTVEIPIRLQNLLDKPIYGPIKVEVVSFGSRKRDPATKKRFELEGALLNSINGKTGAGAIIDYSKAIGDFVALPPGGVTEGVLWRMKAPKNADEIPYIEIKVTARVQRPKEAPQTKQTAAKP